jgi:hypothetical protein
MTTGMGAAVPRSGSLAVVAIVLLARSCKLEDIASVQSKLGAALGHEID